MIDITSLKEHIFDIVGCLYDVHSKLGPGLNEYVYQEGLEIELSNKKIPFTREYTFHPLYDGNKMRAEYRLDFICKGDVIIELKAISILNEENRSQLYNYLRLTNAKCGILVNFAPDYAVIERYFYDSETRTIYKTNGEPLLSFKKNSYR